MISLVWLIERDTKMCSHEVFNKEQEVAFRVDLMAMRTPPPLECELVDGFLSCLKIS